LFKQEIETENKTKNENHGEAFQVKDNVEKKKLPQKIAFVFFYIAYCFVYSNANGSFQSD